MSKGTLYLIPSTLGGDDPAIVVPQTVFEVVNSIDHYIVEHEKHARRYLRSLNIDKPIAELTLYPLNKHTEPSEIPSFLNAALEGENIGVISEAGCPGVADPGAAVVAIAHSKGIPVVPLVGPSSILMGLMASGFNGQEFTFSGYLPKDRKARIHKLHEMERAAKRGHTHIFMDTPFRNQHVLEDVLDQCSPTTSLCIACDITLPSEFIRTKKLSDWRKQQPNLHKRPTMFLMGRDEV
jgi:16S rRNA (cytidine1402-2'-O)-methyltransferase